MSDATAVRTRRYAHLTWPEVRDAQRAGAGVIIPVGATEQHGPHLPLAVDALIAEEIALAVAPQTGMLVAPTICYGNRSRPLAGGGEGFPGTLSLGAHAFMDHLIDVLKALARNGFERLVILNWHYENTNFLYEAAYLAREASASRDLRIMVIEGAFGELSEPTMDLLFADEFPGWEVEHAAILETSLLLHRRPELVLMDRAVDDASIRRTSYDVVPPPADFVTGSGVLWKATQATVAKGEAAWNDIIDRLTDAISAELGEKRETASGY